LAEEKIQAIEMQFRHLLEAIPVGIFTYEGTKIRYLNPACERITGYTRDELYLSDVWKIVHPEYKDRVIEYVQRRRREPVPELHEFKIITKSGEERWLERGAIAIEVKGKTVVLVTIMDVTQRCRRGIEEIRRKISGYPGKCQRRHFTRR
jgi:PAS domain S-box-containing protein